MTRFIDSMHVERVDNAHFYVDALFKERFGVDFPIPRDNCGLSIPTPPENWRQYVAFYKWDAQHIEPVGFCNWIQYDDAYLEGGLCVSGTFYRRLSRAHFSECRERGGVAQLMMERGAAELNDRAAWFGNVGDKQSMIVTKRVGYVTTPYPNIIVKWFKDLPAAKREELMAKIYGIGPF